MLYTDPFSFEIAEGGYLREKVYIDWINYSNALIDIWGNCAYKFIDIIKYINKNINYTYYITIDDFNKPNIFTLHINNTIIKLSLLKDLTIYDVDILFTDSNPYNIYKYIGNNNKNINIESLIINLSEIVKINYEFDALLLEQYKLIGLLGSSIKINSNIIDNTLKYPNIIIYDLIYEFLNNLTILEIDKEPNLYIKYFNILYKIKNSKIEFTELYKQLINVTKDLSYANEILQYITSKDNNHTNAIKEHQIKKIDIPKTHLFYDMLLSHNNINPKTIRRIITEISSLQSSLPSAANSLVALRSFNETFMMLSILIAGPINTPYENGLFEFCISLPDDYPNTPPAVLLKTTNNNRVRFNPNLYADGTVCLSLLNTWKGSKEEQWNPKTSTLLQIIVSIQGLIMVEEPYYNEPGYETKLNTNKGWIESCTYNKNVYINTLKYAIINHIKNPPEGFEDFCKIYFKHNISAIIKKFDNCPYFNSADDEHALLKKSLYSCNNVDIYA